MVIIIILVIVIIISPTHFKQVNFPVIRVQDFIVLKVILVGYYFILVKQLVHQLPRGVRIRSYNYSFFKVIVIFINIRVY